MICLEEKNLDALFQPLQKSKVLIVDDEPVMHVILSGLLEGLVQYHSHTEAGSVIQVVEDYQPDLILLDINMPEIDGLSLCHILKANEETSEIPVIFITSLESEEQENRCWLAGAADFIRKPFNQLTVLHRIHNHLMIQQQRVLLEKQAVQDPLTKMNNRRYMDQQLPEDIRCARCQRWPLSVLLIDVDFFKAYNDTYGHPAGDACLEFVAEKIESVIDRTSDWAARIGGEEFLITLPKADVEKATEIAESLIAAMSAAKKVHEGSMFGIVTVSIGVACWEPGYHSASDLISAADLNLYHAKESGRNKVIAPQKPERPNVNYGG